MLEKPDIPEERILACAGADFGLHAASVAFLPLGADQNTASYRLVTGGGTAYFLKLRSGSFDEMSAVLPKLLNEQGIAQVIAPLPTLAGQLWAGLDSFAVLLYPFVEGRSGYEVELTDGHWVELGAALKRIHTAALPQALTSRIRQERYSPKWRDSVTTFLKMSANQVFDDPVAAKTAALLRGKREQILDLVGRAERCARDIQAHPHRFVVCHSDLHAGNVLIASSGALYIVDWDSPILAPKERDLMYAGGGQFGSRRTPQEEEALFYRGYGETAVDPLALAYYRYERIVQDIAEFCKQLLLTDEGGEDREQSFHYLASNFLPNGVLDITRRIDKTGAASWG